MDNNSSTEPRNEHTALLIVDVQNDFCPGGALAVREGDQVVPAINAISGRYPLVVTTQDWHPPDHISFADRGGPWPPHCVASTPGADLHPDLNTERIAFRVKKGNTRDEEAYSGFHGTNLAEELRKREVTDVVIAGLTTDYCVRTTALDALAEGFNVTVLADATRAVDVSPGDGERALDELRAAGVSVVE